MAVGKYPIIDGVLTIPEGVTVIDAEAFYERCDLIKVILPSTITEISRIAFQECVNLESINIPEGVQKIGNSAFEHCCSLTSIHIPAATDVKKNVFTRCTGLRSITVAEGNPYIDSRCGCNAIINTATDTLVYGCPATVVPDGVMAIGERTFYFCDGLKSITLPESVTVIGIDAFAGCGDLETIVLPEGLETIEEGAFCYCKALKNIVIPSTVKTIAKNAFADCVGLAGIYIPAGTTIHASAFKGCGLTSVSVDDSHPIYDSREECNAVIETNTDKLILGCSATVIPEGVREIARGAFEHCKELETIDIPQTVMAIETAAFSATGLKKITLPDGLTSIESAVFSECEQLESVELPRNLKSICMSAFSKCRNLKAIDIPAGVEEISSSAFEECSSLAAIRFPYGSKVYDASEGINAIVKGDTLLRGCNGTVIPESVTSIGSGAFTDSVLSNLMIPKTVTRLGNWVFRRCSIKESISVEEGNPNYDSRGGCNAIIETATDTLLYGFGVTVIPEGVKTISSFAFAGCNDLNEIVIPAGVKKIAEGAFKNCVNLKTVTLPAGVGKIECDVFKGCTALETINVAFGKVDYYKSRLPESLHDKLVELPKPGKKK